MMLFIILILFIAVFVISGMKSYIFRDLIEELHSIDELLNGR